MGAQRQADCSVPSGQGACRGDGICSGADRLSGGFPDSGRTSPAQGYVLYGAVLPGRKAVRRTGFPHPRARSVPGRWHLLRRRHTARRNSEHRRTFPAQGHRLYGLCCPAGRQYSRQVFRTPGQSTCREDGISSGAGTLSGGFPGSGKASPLHGQCRPKTNTPAAQARPCGGSVFMYGNRTDQTSS